jgi:hypothetical protein
MTQRKSSRSKKTDLQRPPAPQNNLLLTLTLVPLVLGILLIGAWALDIPVLGDYQSQITLGILFALASFTASNVLTRRLQLAAGWGLLTVADLVLLISLALWAQIVAIAVGIVGLVLLLVEFYRQYRQNQERQGRK